MIFDFVIDEKKVNGTLWSSKDLKSNWEMIEFLQENKRRPMKIISIGDNKKVVLVNKKGVIEHVFKKTKFKKDT